MGVEIERKFLVNLPEWDRLNKPKGIAFRQGYMVREKEKTVRIRIADDHAFITIKGESAGFSRSEYENTIPTKDAEELLISFCKEVIVKTRYCIDHAGKTWEVDVFAGDNDGLIVAEIELESEHEQFDLPAWIAQEVTGDNRYYNSNLSVHPYTTW